MRVIGGIKKSMRLDAPKGMNTRPTEDRIRENVFNLIGPVEGICLDLFAGSGALGIEFLSRGAEFSYFVDNSYNCIKIIKNNLQRTGFSDCSEVICKDGLKALDLFYKEGVKFDYIYIDPPYKKDVYYEKSLEKISSYDLLRGIVVIESPSKLNLSSKEYKVYKERIYGDKKISIWEL